MAGRWKHQNRQIGDYRLRFTYINIILKKKKTENERKQKDCYWKIRFYGLALNSQWLNVCHWLVCVWMRLNGSAEASISYRRNFTCKTNDQIHDKTIFDILGLLYEKLVSISCYLSMGIAWTFNSYCPVADQTTTNGPHFSLKRTMYLSQFFENLILIIFISHSKCSSFRNPKKPAKM